MLALVCRQNFYIGLRRVLTCLVASSYVWIVPHHAHGYGQSMNVLDSDITAMGKSGLTTSQDMNMKSQS